MSEPVSAATREAYPAGLLQLVEDGVDVVAIDADLSVSTMGYQFGDKHPSRWQTVGVAEQNMVGIAAGFAAASKTPFIASFASFLPGRCFDRCGSGLSDGSSRSTRTGSWAPEVAARPTAARTTRRPRREARRRPEADSARTR